MNFTRRSVTGAIALSLAAGLAGCATVAGQGPSLPSLSALIGKNENGERSYNLFFNPADHVKELLDAGQVDKAAGIYNENHGSFFSKDEGKYAALGARLAAELDAAHGAEYSAAIAAISAPSSNAAGWPQVRQAFARAEKLKLQFGAAPAARAGKRTVPNFDAFAHALKEKRTAWERTAPAEFAGFDHASNFFQQYPAMAINPAELINASADMIKPKLASKGRNAVLAFYNTYQSELTGTPNDKPGAALAMVSNLYVAQEVTQASDPNRLRNALKALADAKAAGLVPTDVPLKVAFADATSKTLLKEGQIEFPVSINVDLPLAVAKTSVEEVLSGSRPDADYVVVLDVAAATTRQNVASRDAVPSAYQNGTRQVPNPAYESARMSVYQAQSAFNQNQAQYCYGMGCIGKGIAGIVLATALKEKSNAFESTPMVLTEPVYRDYEFHASDMTASRAVTANYYIIDWRANTYFKSIFDIAEEKKFVLAYNLHENDRNRSTHLRNYSTESDIKQFNEAPATIQLSAVLDQFLKSGTASQPLKSLAALRTELTADKNRVLTAYADKAKKQSSSVKEDARFESVVVVRNPKGGTGAGFFVAPDVVMTNYHVIEGATFIEMKMHNGLDTFGKVIKSDVRLDLALIKVQTRGTPATFFDGQIPLGAAVEAIGHPRGLEFSITRGVVSAVRKMQGVMNVGGKDVTFVQTDTPLNPGNSGGPLFFNGQIIGINDFKFSRDGIEGISFAIHYTEAQDFLKELK